MELQQAIKANSETPENPPRWWNLSAEEAGDHFRDPRHIEELRNWAKTNADTLNRHGVAGPKLKAFEAASGAYGSVPYKKSLGMTWNSQPYSFDGPAYKEGAKGEEVAAEIKRLDGIAHGVVKDKKLSEMTEADLENEVNVFGSLRGIADELGDSNTSIFQNAVADRVANPQSGWFQRATKNKDAMDSHLEAVHRMRVLNRQRGEVSTARVEPKPAQPKEAYSTAPVKNQAKELALEAERAAKHFGEETSAGVALRDFAVDLNSQADDIADAEQLSAIRDANSEAVQLIMRYMHEKRQS